MNVCQKMCQMHSASSDGYGLQVAWLVVDLITNSLATNDDKFKSEFHRHVSVSQNEGLKDPVKIWQ